jgi:glycerate dehydrogenase
METIVFLERNTLDARLRRPGFEHEWRDYGETSPDQIVERLSNATIAVVNKARLPGEVLKQLPRLRLIAVAATGTDNIDLDYCRSHNIGVVNVRGYAVRTVPEHVLALVLALRRNLLAFRTDVERGLWERAHQFCLLTHPISDLFDSTMGVIGYGALGQATARLASAVGMKMLVAEHKGAAAIRDGRTPFETVLRDSDVISLHAPLTPQTRGMIGRAELMSMRKTSVLINCARGGLVDENALGEALKNGIIAGAGVDVLSQEPPSSATPNPLLKLALPNLIVTPHVAWASREAMQMLADQLIENIEAFQRRE